MGWVPPKPAPIPKDPQKRAEWYAYHCELYDRGARQQGAMFWQALGMLAGISVVAAIVSLCLLL